MNRFRITRPLLLALALALLLLGPVQTLAESAPSMFVPEFMVSTYNDDILSFLKFIKMDSDTAQAQLPFFSFELKSEEDGKLVYANTDSTLVLTYSAGSPSETADQMTLWANLGDESKWKNIPCIAFAYSAVVHGLDGITGDDFLHWVNDAKEDGATFETDGFSAVYAITKDVECGFTLTRK